MSESASQSSSNRLDRGRRAWLNPRRKRFWAIALLTIYTVIGFLVLPWLGKRLAVNFLHNEHGRSLRIAELRINPYIFRVELAGVELDDRDGHKLAGFEQLVLDLQWSSLINQAWTFRELRLVGPWFDEERSANGDSRFGRLISEFSAKKSPDEPLPEESGLPPLIIEHLQLLQGRGRWTDQEPKPPVSLGLGPVTVDIRGFDTHPDQTSEQTVQIHFEDDSSLSWSGSFTLEPLTAEGSLELNRIIPDKALPYIRRWVALNDLHLIYDGRLDYRISLTAKTGIEVALTNIGLEITELALSAFTPDRQFLSTKAIRLGGGEFHYPEMRAVIDTLEIDSPELETWIEPDGQPALMALLPTPVESSENAPEPEEPSQFALDLKELRINGLLVSLEDRTLDTPAHIVISNTDVNVKSINLVPGSKFPARISGTLASTGQFLFDGNIGANPNFTMDGQVKVADLPLTIAQPYLNPVARIGIDDGLLSLDGEFSSTSDEPLDYSGTFRIDQLQLSHQVKNESLLGWSSLSLEQLHLALGERKLETGRGTFDKPSGRLVINVDHSTNFSSLLIPMEAATAPEKKSGDDPFHFEIGGVALNQGSLHFTDLSLPLPFSTHLQNLTGQISSISASSTEPATVKLEGQVDDHGLSLIDGSLRPLDPLQFSNIRMEFRNLAMPHYSPYSIQFAGRAIASGRLDLDLRYRVKGGLMQGENNIVLRDFKLGEKVNDSDTANVPLDLAVSLLKDPNGVIDIHIPVEGDANSPKFQIGGVIWQAISGRISKVATSPFRALGALIGIKSDDFGRFQFLAGRSDLTPPQVEMAMKLQKALLQRPQLGVKISGTYDRVIDRQVLQQKMALAAVRSWLGTGNAALSNLTLTDKTSWPALESLFVEAYPDTSLKEIKTLHSKPPDSIPHGRPVLDKLTYYRELAAQIIAAQPIVDDNLEALGIARAEAIRQALLNSEASEPEIQPAVGEESAPITAAITIAADRISVSEPIEVTAEEDGRITVKLKVMAQ